MSPVITASAPGKLVLFGEYAVLTGAPGAAMALDVSARCTFEPDPSVRRWTIETLGFDADPVSTYLPAIIIEPPPPADSATFLLWYALNSIKGKINELPAGGTLTLDSRDFQQSGRKLGIGSSAAVCTALTALLETLAGTTPALNTALVAHRTAQGGKGSGLDVAAAFQGGLTELRWPTPATLPNAVPRVRALNLDATLAYQVFWTTTPASTTAFVTRFSDWLTENPRHQALRALCRSAEHLTQAVTLNELAVYIEALQAFDQTTGLGIYTPMHQELHDLAQAAGVLYKPCGAGGGDIGIVLASSEAALERYRAAVDEHWANPEKDETGAERAKPLPLALRLSKHGVRIQSR